MAAASFIQRWYRKKRELEHQEIVKSGEVIEPEIFLPAHEEAATHKDTSEDNEEQESVDCEDGIERALAMGAVKVGIAIAVTRVGSLVLNGISAPVDQDDVVAAIVIAKGSEAQ